MTCETRAKDVLLKYYDENSDIFRLLWHHSCQVAEMTVGIALNCEGKADAEFVYEAALLHDIGIFRTFAPKIFCNGTEPYIRHGLIGSELLKAEGMPRHALVCERHTGAGLSREEIIAQNLPLPHQDMLPVSIEEKIICYADKFFSKSSPDKIKTVKSIRHSMARFGEGQLRRFDEMHALFGDKQPAAE